MGARKHENTLEFELKKVMNLLIWALETEQSLLKEQQALLTTESSFQLLGPEFLCHMVLYMLNFHFHKKFS